MNLHAIAGPAVAAVNPTVEVTVRPNTGGYVTNPDGSRTPSFGPSITAKAQIQSLTYNDIMQLDGLSLNGERRAIYLTGDLQALDRPDQRGGDLVIFPNGTTWLVAQVLEHWPDWCKVAVTQQVVAS